MSQGRGKDAVVIRLSALGDVVLMTGVLDYWHRTRGMSFRVITRSVFAPLFENHPAVLGIIPIGEKQLSGMRWFGNAWRLARCLSHRHLIDLHGTFRSGILSILWQGQVFKYPKYTMERRRFLKNRSKEAQKKLLRANVPQRYAMALDDSPPRAEDVMPKVVLRDDERQLADSMLRRHGVKRPFAVLHPYAVHTAKMWPEESWKALAELLNDNGLDWIVIGRSGNQFMERIAGPKDLTNATDLRTTCAILALATVLVSGDSGPIHLASAARTPVVALFGPTSREWGFYPNGPNDRILELILACRPCSFHGKKECKRGEECLRGIESMDVLEEVLAASS